MTLAGNRVEVGAWIETQIRDQPKEIMRTMRVELDGLSGYYMEAIRYCNNVGAKHYSGMPADFKEWWELISPRVFIPDNKT